MSKTTQSPLKWRPQQLHRLHLRRPLQIGATSFIAKPSFTKSGAPSPTGHTSRSEQDETRSAGDARPQQAKGKGGKGRKGKGQGSHKRRTGRLSQLIIAFVNPDNLIYTKAIAIDAYYFSATLPSALPCTVSTPCAFTFSASAPTSPSPACPSLTSADTPLGMNRPGQNGT